MKFIIYITILGLNFFTFAGNTPSTQKESNDQTKQANKLDVKTETQLKQKSKFEESLTKKVMNSSGFSQKFWFFFLRLFYIPFKTTIAEFKALKMQESNNINPNLSTTLSDNDLTKKHIQYSEEITKKTIALRQVNEMIPLSVQERETAQAALDEDQQKKDEDEDHQKEDEDEDEDQHQQKEDEDKDKINNNNKNQPISATSTEKKNPSHIHISEEEMTSEDEVEKQKIIAEVELESKKQELKKTREEGNLRLLFIIKYFVIKFKLDKNDKDKTDKNNLKSLIQNRKCFGGTIKLSKIKDDSSKVKEFQEDEKNKHEKLIKILATKDDPYFSFRQNLVKMAENGTIKSVQFKKWILEYLKI